MKRIFLHLVVSLLLVCAHICYAPYAEAYSGKTSVLSLIRQGVLHYQKGDIVVAIHEFTKALMVDPSNKTAQHFLDKISGHLYNRHNIDEDQVVNLQEEIARHKRKIENLNRKVKQVKVAANEQLSRDKEDIKKLRRSEANKEKEIIYLKADVDEMSDDLDRKSALIKDKTMQLSGLDTELKKQKKQIKLVKAAADEQASHDTRVIKKLKHSEEKKGKEIIYLRADMVRLKDDLKKKDELIKEKTLQTAGLNVELDNFARRFKIAEKTWHESRLVFEREINNLQNGKVSLGKERDVLRRDILAKEAENNDLKQKIVQTQRDAKKQSDLDRSLVKNMKKSSREMSEEVVLLKDELVKLNNKLNKKNNLLEEREGRLSGLSKELKELARQFNVSQRKWESGRFVSVEERDILERAFDEFKVHAVKLDDKRKEQIDNLRDLLRKTRIELGYSSNKLLSLGYKLENRDNQLYEKNKEIVMLNSSLLEFEQKLKELKAGIKHAKVIEKSTPYVETSLKEVGINEASLKDNAEKILWIKKQDKVIADLKAQLAFSRKEVRALTVDMQKSFIPHFLNL